MLQAQLKVEPRSAERPEEFRAEGVLRNVGESVEQIRSALMASPSLALEIADQNGEPVLLPPPPVPGAEERDLRLEAGAEFRTIFASFLPAWTEPGTYRIRLRYQQTPESPTVSEWVQFELASPFAGHAEREPAR